MEIKNYSLQSYVRGVRTKQIDAGVVILHQSNLLSYYFPDELLKASLKGLYAALLILTRE